MDLTIGVSDCYTGLSDTWSERYPANPYHEYDRFSADKPSVYHMWS